MKVNLVNENLPNGRIEVQASSPPRVGEKVQIKGFGGTVVKVRHYFTYSDFGGSYVQAVEVVLK